eukprot:TRINITY_DN2233_c0_g1_i1.p1 TRINITY_DN2233_c0_g1~~TRINITY_DN2233_c0_g1_i1.p1  ORF type:complete len:165 (+),score=32.20 TRINITY_DN2233_c0_g1_i1:51-545(+)
MSKQRADKWANFKNLTPAQRLQKRDLYYSEDNALPLAVGSGDLEGVKWMIEKGFPLNYKVQDNAGMCHDVWDLADSHGQAKIAAYFRDKAKAGPPRQKILLRYNDKETEFIMPNSKEDWKMFKDEVERHFGTKRLKICNRGDDSKKKLGYMDLREGRKYLVFNK